MPAFFACLVDFWTGVSSVLSVKCGLVFFGRGERGSCCASPFFFFAGRTSLLGGSNLTGFSKLTEAGGYPHV
jgi:hypothetical protein